MGSLSAYAAAQKLSQPISALLAGSNASISAELVRAASSLPGLEKLFVVKHDGLAHMLAEPLTPVLEAVQRQNEYSHWWAVHSTLGKSLMPRFAARLDAMAIADIVEVGDGETFVRPIYAGNALSTVKSSDKLKIITVRGTGFAPVEFSNKETTAVEEPKIEIPKELLEMTTWEKEELTKSERPELGAASIVISGGRALKSSENFALLYKLAEKLGAAVGASRAAVDAGYVPNDMQVGQTGKIVAPQLYIAIGISGAIQHVAGMKDSKVIVAINKDGDAPIFQIADYGLVGDLFAILPELTEKLPTKS